MHTRRLKTQQIGTGEHTHQPPSQPRVTLTARQPHVPSCTVGV